MWGGLADGTYTWKDPYKAVESLELDTTEFLNLLAGQIMECRIPSNQCVECDVGDWPGSRGLLSTFYML